MKSLLLVLRSMGFSDIKFLIVNSEDASSPEVRSRLNERVNGSSIKVFQDNESSTVWTKLGGSRGDILIYDRCGRLTYFIPNHLSVLSPKKPIVQTTILSAYFDNPCGRSCEVKNAQLVPEEDAEQVSSGLLNNTIDAPLKTPNVMADMEYNSTAQPADFRVIVNTSAEYDVFGNKSEEETGNGTETMSLPWRIFDFFLSQMGQTSSTTATSVLFNETERSVSQIETLDSNNSNSTDMLDSNMTTITPLTTTMAVTCDANECREFSTDAILRARLCCLAEEVGQDGESTFGCRNYSKQMCDQMMPLIKCCLKDFAELLANFFHREGSSSQRQRKASFAG